MHVEGTPQEAYEEAGEEIADGIDGGEGPEGHAVLLLADNLGGERVFEGFFGADVEARKDENHREQRKRICSRAKKNRSDAGKAVPRGEHGFAMPISLEETYRRLITMLDRGLRPPSGPRASA